MLTTVLYIYFIWNPISSNIKIEHDPIIKSNHEDERSFHGTYHIVKERDKEEWQGRKLDIRSNKR